MILPLTVSKIHFDLLGCLYSLDNSVQQHVKLYMTHKGPKGWKCLCITQDILRFTSTALPWGRSSLSDYWLALKNFGSGTRPSKQIFRWAHKYTRDVFHIGHNRKSEYLCVVGYTQSKGSNFLAAEGPTECFHTCAFAFSSSLIWSMPYLVCLSLKTPSPRSTAFPLPAMCVLTASHTADHTLVTHFSDQGDHRTGVKG